MFVPLGPLGGWSILVSRAVFSGGGHQASPSSDNGSSKVISPFALTAHLPTAFQPPVQCPQPGTHGTGGKDILSL